MPHPKVKLSDDSGNAVSVTGNRLDVNAYLSATPTIDIGDVSLLLGGTAADTGLGVYGAQTLRVTIAADDALLTTISNNIIDCEALLTTIDTDTGNLPMLGYISRQTGSTFGVSNYGINALAVRNDTLEATVGITDGEYSPLQTDSIGGLYVTGSEIENAAVQSEPLLVGGRYDSSARTLGDGDAGAVALNASGHVLTTDDTHWGTVGTAADADGTAHGQLRYIANTVNGNSGHLTTITSNTSTISTILSFAASTTGGQYTEGDGGFLATGVRNNTLASLVSVDHDHAPFQVNAEGAVYTTGNTLQGGSLHGENFTVMGESKTIDGSALPNVTAEGRNIRLAASTSGILYTCLTDDAGASDLGTTITTHLSEIEGAVETIEGAVSGSEMQVDIVAALPAGSNTIGVVDLGSTDNAVLDAIAASLALLDNSIASGSELQVDVVAALPAGSNAIGKLAANSGVDIGDVDVTSISAGTNAIGKVGHDITGMVSDGNTTISDSTAEQLDGSTSGLDIACKRVDFMAAHFNTGYIWVGDSGVVNNGSGGGIRLAPGDFYSIDVNNLNDIWVIATVDEENLTYIYFT